MKRLAAVLTILQDPDNMAKVYAFDVIANFIAVPIFLTMYSEPYVMNRMGTILKSIFEMSWIVKKIVNSILDDPKHSKFRKEVEKTLVDKLQFKNWKATQCWAQYCKKKPEAGSCYCCEHHISKIHDNEEDPLAINRPPKNCSRGFEETKKYVPFLFNERDYDEHPDEQKTRASVLSRVHNSEYHEKDTLFELKFAVSLNLMLQWWEHYVFIYMGEFSNPAFLPLWLLDKRMSKRIAKIIGNCNIDDVLEDIKKQFDDPDNIPDIYSIFFDF